MKVYRVTMAHFDGDHDHGYYESPLFATRELADAFKAAIVSGDEGQQWWSDEGMENVGPESASVEEVEVVEAWDASKLKPARNYLTTTYT